MLCSMMMFFTDDSGDTWVIHASVSFFGELIFLFADAGDGEKLSYIDDNIDEMLS